MKALDGKKPLFRTNGEGVPHSLLDPRLHAGRQDQFAQEEHSGNVG